MRLLVVEDNERVSAALSGALAEQGMDVVRAGTGEAAVDLLRTAPELVLLDLGLPDRDGFEVCERIRRVSAVPIVVTTARGDYTSCVRALDLGADDYLVKPYNLAELLARIRAVARRARYGATAPAEPGPDILFAGPLRIDVRERAVLRGGLPVELPDDEFDLLVALARRPGEVRERDPLADEVWRAGRATLHRRLPGRVGSLRRRLGTPHLIESVGSTGYRLAVPSGDPR